MWLLLADKLKAVQNYKYTIILLYYNIFQILYDMLYVNWSSGILPLWIIQKSLDSIMDSNVIIKQFSETPAARLPYILYIIILIVSPLSWLCPRPWPNICFTKFGLLSSEMWFFIYSELSYTYQDPMALWLLISVLEIA